jgi:hypothetical protein
MPRVNMAKKWRIVLIGDSHIEQCSGIIHNSLNDSYSVIGVTKPTANLETITSTRNFRAENYTRNDDVTLCGGTKDIGRNETNNGLCHLTYFVKGTENNRVIIVEVPHHYDLEHSSCVNKEVAVHNRKLHEVVETFKHVQVLNMSGNAIHFTSHSLHMSSSGKAWICNEIVKKIQDLFSPECANTTIPLYWKEPQSTFPEDQFPNSEAI